MVMLLVVVKNIYVRDWDGDGDLDIIDAWQPGGVPAGVMVPLIC